MIGDVRNHVATVATSTQKQIASSNYIRIPTMKKAREPWLKAYAEQLRSVGYLIQMHRDGGFTVKNPLYKSKKKKEPPTK